MSPRLPRVLGAELRAGGQVCFLTGSVRCQVWDSDPFSEAEKLTSVSHQTH